MMWDTWRLMKKTETGNYAGRIPKIWMQNAMADWGGNPAGDGTIEDWFVAASNHSLKISEDRTVWDADAGAWLTQERIDQLCELIDQGV